MGLMRSSDSHLQAHWLHQRRPLHRLSENELGALAINTPVLKAATGDCLIELGSLDEHALYLVKGRLRLVAEDGRETMVSDTDDKALDPVSHLTPHHYDVFCQTDVQYILISNEVLDNITRRQDHYDNYIEGILLPESLANNRLFQMIHQALMEDTLELPPIPDVAVRVRNIVAAGGDGKDMERLLITDPALAASLIKIANSPVFYTQTAVVTVREAILRVGMDVVRDYVILHATEKLFASHAPYTRKRMADWWKHSTEVAAVCYVIAKELPGFDPDRALLMGLLHDIGMLPIITFVDRNQDMISSQQELDQLIRDMHGDLGAMMMAKWHFPRDFIDVSREADNWQRNPSAAADYCDIVLVAQLHSFIGKKFNEETPPMNARDIPHVNEVPAFAKLGFDQQNPEHSYEIITSAKHNLYSLKSLLIAS